MLYNVILYNVLNKWIFGVFFKHSVISQEKICFYTLFELLERTLVEAACSFNLIDEENDDEELEILLYFVEVFFIL